VAVLRQPSAQPAARAAHRADRMSSGGRCPAVHSLAGCALRGVLARRRRGAAMWWRHSRRGSSSRRRRLSAHDSRRRDR
jgi:hypothetical protein